MMIFENGSTIETLEIPDTSNTIRSKRSEVTTAIIRRDVCWYCGGKLFLGSDFNYDEVFGEGEGIVSYLTCSGCGAEVQYSLLDEEED